MKRTLAKIHNFILVSLAWISAIVLIICISCMDSEGEAFFVVYKVFLIALTYLALFICANVDWSDVYDLDR